MSERVSILLVDDHPVVREGVATMLRTDGGFEIVAEASTGPEAIEAYGEHAPDVVLLDLELPEMSGVDVVEALHAEWPDPQILVFTAFDDDERIVAAVKAGIDGYLLKGAPRDELFDAIRRVAGGETLLDASVTSRLMDHVRSEEDGEAVELTPREGEVLEQMAGGLSNRRIGEELHISERTVKFHVSSILEKLEVDNRTEAVTVAIERDLV